MEATSIVGTVAAVFSARAARRGASGCAFAGVVVATSALLGPGAFAGVTGGVSAVSEPVASPPPS